MRVEFLWMKFVAGKDNFVAGIACFRLSLAKSLALFVNSCVLKSAY